MAVIKVVPMPGMSVTGPVGPQGPQGDPGVLIESGTWNPNFNDSTSAMTETGASTGTYGEYYAIGDIVHFDMQYNFQNVTSYGPGYFLFRLPFPPKDRSGWSNNTVLHGLIFDQTNPDMGKNVVFGTIQTSHPVTANDDGWVLLWYQNTSNELELSPMTESNPASLSGSQTNPYNMLRMSGTYWRA